VTSPGDQSSVEGATISLAIQASDPDGNTLTYTATGLPTGLTINATSGVISGTIAFGAPATNTVVVTASDGSLSGTATFAWTVTRTNRAPTVTSPGDQSSVEGATISLAIQASDPDGNTLTYTATGLPTGLTINATSGVISGTIAFGAPATNTVVVTASDGSLSGTATFAWTVTNTNRAPTVTSPGNQTTLEGSTVTLAISASDPDGDTLTYSATGLVPGLGINPATGVISGTIPIGAAGSYSVVVTVNDGALTGTAGFTWTVTRRPPSAPTNLAAAAVSASQITLSWSDTSITEDGFRIERSTRLNGNGNFVEVARVGPDVTTFSSTGLNASTTYYFRVQAYNTGGTSAYSNVANATTLPAGSVPPNAPSNLVATANSSSQITLTWTDNATNETGVSIQRSTDGVNFTQLITVGANTTAYVNGGLDAGTTYYYRVQAYNGGGASADSNTANATTFPATATPAPPTNLVGTANSATQITLAWADNSNNEQGFLIERALGSGAFVQIAITGGNVSTFVDAGLTRNTTYRYRVRAFNASGNSAYSNTVSVRTNSR
jgi:hypothetical protein